MTALTIAFVPGVSPAKWSRVWRDRFPDVDLYLTPIGHHEVDSALDGDAEMAFARLPVTDGLQAIPLWTETAVVAAPKDSELAGHDELTTADLSGVTVLGDGPLPDDVDAALDLVEANVGVVVLPQSLFRKASRRGLVGRPLVDSPGTRIALVWRDADANDLTEEFIGVVRGRTANSSRGRQDDDAPVEAPAKAPRPARAQPAKRTGGSGRPTSAGARGRRAPTKGGKGKSGGKGRSRR